MVAPCYRTKALGYPLLVPRLRLYQRGWCRREDSAAEEPCRIVLVQECRRAWERDGLQYSCDQLTGMAAEASVRGHSRSGASRQARRCALDCHPVKTGQKPPADCAAYARVIVAALAWYRQVLENLERLAHRKIETIHIMGGGWRNRLLKLVHGQLYRPGRDCRPCASVRCQEYPGASHGRGRNCIWKNCAPSCGILLCPRGSTRGPRRNGIGPTSNSPKIVSRRRTRMKIQITERSRYVPPKAD
jgi:hypothetical protein